MQKNLLLTALLPIAILCANTAFAAETLDGVTVGVTDGDTATILDSDNRQHIIRLADVDTPETTCHAKKPSARDEACLERGQPFGKTAKRNLSDLIYGKTVHVVLKGSSSYAREIGTIFVDGQDVNYIMVSRGMAWHYKTYARKDQTPSEYARYENAEITAQTRQLGLWSDASNPIPPWEYRKTSKRRAFQ